jgi:hypothetical protein
MLKIKNWSVTVVKKNKMKYIGIALIYLGFFGLIGYAAYITKSPNVLWALLLTPDLNIKN